MQKLFVLKSHQEIVAFILFAMIHVQIHSLDINDKHKLSKHLFILVAK